MEVFLAVIAVVALWSWVAQRRVSAELIESHDDPDMMIICRVEWHGSQCYVYVKTLASSWVRVRILTRLLNRWC